MIIDKFVSRIFAFVLSFFLISPILLVVLFAFTDRAIASFPINSLSLKWWVEIFNHRQFASCLYNSVTIGLSVALVSSITGTMAAVGLSKLPTKTASINASNNKHTDNAASSCIGNCIIIFLCITRNEVGVAYSYY